MSATRPLESAAVEALVVYLAGVLTGVTVLRGWPEGDTALDMATPTLSVESVPGMEESVCSPAPLGNPSAGVAVYKIGDLTIPIQMDLWAAYRETLDTYRLAVDAALANALPARPHLYLTATDHDARPFRVRRISDGGEIDGETAQRGEWRHTWQLRIDIERVASVTMAPTTTITVSPTVT